jgi:hypothetical protein
MRISRFAVSLLIVAALAVLAVLAWQRTEIRRLRSAEATSTATLGRAPTTTTANDRATATTPVASASPATVSSDRASPARSQVTAVDQRNREFVEQLHLNESEAAALRKLRLDRLNIRADLIASADRVGSALSKDPAALAAAENQAKAELDTQIAALLGPERFALYQTFDKDQRSITTVGNLQKLLNNAGAPLTAAQSSTLQDALTAQGPLQFGVRQVTDEIVADAESYLSPKQLGALREFQQKQREVVQAKILLRERAAANPPNR